MQWVVTETKKQKPTENATRWLANSTHSAYVEKLVFIWMIEHIYWVCVHEHIYLKKIIVLECCYDTNVLNVDFPKCGNLYQGSFPHTNPLKNRSSVSISQLWHFSDSKMQTSILQEVTLLNCKERRKWLQHNILC